MLNENGEELVKCERRYNNFYKFNLKLRKKYPYCLIPKLTEKHPITNLIYKDNNEEFYLNREIQLRFYLSYIIKHDILSNSKELHKFLNDAEFDENYFSQDDLPCSFSISSNITESMKNKVIGMFKGLFGGDKQDRKPSDDERKILTMESYYKNILEKYTEMKQNICTYLKSIDDISEEYRKLVHSYSYLRDNVNDDLDNSSKEQYKYFSSLSQSLYELSKDCVISQANLVENQLEVNISLI
jgi:hypothetical protein